MVGEELTGGGIVGCPPYVFRECDGRYMQVYYLLVSEH